MTVSQQRIKAKQPIPIPKNENPTGIDMHDKVKHSKTNATGEVIAIYAEYVDVDAKKTMPVIDVHLDSSEVGRQVWYGSPLSNWELVRKDEKWQVTNP